MIRSLLRTLPIVALATTLAAVPAAATGSHDNDRSDHAQQQRADDGEDDTAHPSGKSRHEEPGNSGTQGKSTSDPDGDTNGGEDKPGGQGGYDDDKDGNNGCGNDNDFEDDNNGNCGGPDREPQDEQAEESEARNERSNVKESKVRNEQSKEAKARHKKSKRSEARNEKSSQQTRSEHERTEKSTDREVSVSRTLHCEGHADNTKWEGSSGSHTIEGVTISWNGDQLDITNSNDTEATVVWCAKGGKGFAGDSMNTGVNTDTVAAGDTITRTFATDVSYVVVYDIDTDAEVAPGEQNNNNQNNDHTSRDDQDTIVEDTDDTLTDTDATAGGADTGNTAGEDTSVLSDALTAAPAADEDSGVTAAAAADSEDETDVAAAAAAADDDDGISSGGVLALTGGSIAFLAILALLTLGGGSLLVRRNEQH